MQASLKLSTRQVVAGFREVIHSDVLVSGRSQPADRVEHDLKLFLRRRQCHRIDASLWFEALRQVRVVIERDTLRAQQQHLIERSGERCTALMGSP